jgi:hypothetical protein
VTSDQAPQPPDPLPRRVPGSSQLVPGKRPAVPQPRPSQGPGAAGPEAPPPGQQAAGPGARPPDTQTAASGVRRPDGQAIAPDVRPPGEQNGQGVKPRDGRPVTPDIRRPGEQDAGRPAGSPDTQTARPQASPPAAPAGRGDARPGRRPDDPATGPVVPRTGTEVERAASGAVAPRAPAAEVAPSWPRVLGTTVRLWTARRRTWWRVIAALVVVLVVFAAGGLTVALLRNTGSGRAARGGNASGTPGLAQVQAAATARQQAAAWVTAQVSHSAMVSCDPAMCATLEARGFPSGDLLTLGPAASDPLGSAVIVSTAAVRSEIGSRLTSVYAPTVIASFGSGSARVDVRVYAAGGAAAYLAALRADQAVRQHLGSVLLHNSRVSATPAARAQLAAGQVDTRLLAIIATLSAQGPVSIVAFGDAGPGASAGMPLRAVELASPPGAKAAYLSSVLALLRAQQAPYLANSATLARLADGRQIARIQFAAPSPLGLLSG